MFEKMERVKGILIDSKIRIRIWLVLNPNKLQNGVRKHKRKTTLARQLHKPVHIFNCLLDTSNSLIIHFRVIWENISSIKKKERKKQRNKWWSWKLKMFSIIFKQKWYSMIESFFSLLFRRFLVVQTMSITSGNKDASWECS